MSLLVNLVVAVALLALVVGIVLFWSSRREKKRQELIRRRGPDATIHSERRPEQQTDHWNITR